MNFTTELWICAGRTYASSETMELVTNIILNPSYVDNDRTSLLYSAPEEEVVAVQQTSKLISNTVTTTSNPASL